LDELVEDGKNGVVFSDASQLAGQMTVRSPHMLPFLPNVRFRLKT
jgi:hypothetical protein